MELSQNGAVALAEHPIAKCVGKHLGALAVLDWVLERSPNDAAALVERTIARSHFGKLLGALGDLGRALKLSPSDAVPTREHTIVLSRLGKLELSPNDVVALAERTMARVMLASITRPFQIWTEPWS